MDVRDKLNRVFQEVFKNDSIQIKPQTTANDISGWDSFLYATLIVAIEVRFNITFTQREALNFNNVGDLIRCIEKKISV